MRWTIIVTDTFLRFRLAAIPYESPQTHSWQLDVMTIEQVAETLISLRILDPEAAHRLTRASTTTTPQPGLVTIPFATFAALVEIVHPENEPAQEGHCLITKGEATEEALAAAGFVLRPDGPLQ
jgi:hypothetical protein